MRVRRIVTGRSADGKSAIVSEDRVDPITVGFMPGTEFHRIWGSDDPVKLPASGRPPAATSWFPPPGGFRFSFFTLGPAAEGPPDGFDPVAAMAELEEKVPGLPGVIEAEDPGMHTTDTVDLVYVVSGEVVLELDDGVEVPLGPGDCVVQNGTRHAWRNRTSVPCVMAVAMIGATR